MGHGAKDCEEILVKDREEEVDEFPHSTTLREESTLEMGQTVDVDFSNQKVAEDLEEVGKQDPNGGNNNKLKIMKESPNNFSVLEIEIDLWEQI
ncbi:hypothetical protein Golob_011936, partial [Gossypium lobatum]|nr:hypothetical protein [Gossypium lobatum]